MATDVNAFVTQWLYDIEHVLRQKLEPLKGDLLSDDERTEEAAASLVSQILDWLYPPLNSPVSDEQRKQLMRQAMNISDPKESTNAMRRVARSTGRRIGRPRDESSQYAIRALTLHLATDKSWREIALELRGCKHKRPNRERACPACGEKMRQAAIRLKAFLEKHGLYPVMPGHKGLKEMSPADHERLWKSD